MTWILLVLKNNNLGSLLVNNKDEADILRANGVNQSGYENCESIYTEQTVCHYIFSPQW